jgi:hypothetical protein
MFDKNLLKMATDKPLQMNVSSRDIFARFRTYWPFLLSNTQINPIKLALGLITFPSSRDVRSSIFFFLRPRLYLPVEAYL